MFDYDPEFMELFDETTELLKGLFKTKNDVIIMQGEALLGLEAAAVCAIEPGDKCLNLVNGIYSDLFAWYIKENGGELVEVRTEYDNVIDPAAVEKAFQEHPDIKIMAVCHSETPSGTVNPIQDICPIAKKHGAISIVDSVSGIVSTELEVDQWGIDICCIGPQKNLSCSPGLAPISVSDAAWDKLRSKTKPVRYTYMSMLDFKEIWLEKRTWPYTPFTSEVVALNEALKQVFEEGLENVITRHKVAAKMARAGAKGMGLELWPVSEDISGNCATTVKPPEGIDEVQLRDHLYKKYKIIISGGLRDLKGKVFRLGHMGTSAEPAFIVMQIAMIEKSLKDLGFDIKIGSGVAAALDTI